jgi:hypothetical protein
MNPDVVISCPACRHLVRVPEDWLGTQVQCPQCQALFQAPVRQADGSLTQSTLPAVGRRPVERDVVRRRPDWLLFLPAFGLMLTGVIGILVSAWLLLIISKDPDRLRDAIAQQMPMWKQWGLVPNLPNAADQRKAEAEKIEEMLESFRFQSFFGLPISALVVLGGLAIVVRRGYPFALLGSILAIINLPHACCLLGIIPGIWASILLLTPEGREHFRHPSRDELP